MIGIPVGPAVPAAGTTGRANEGPAGPDTAFVDALAAAVKKHGGIPPFAETQAYVRKVIALYYQYKEQHPKADSSEPPK